MRVLGIGVLAIVLSSCDALEGGSCTTSVEPAIRMEIRDSLSGANLVDRATTEVTGLGFAYTLEVSSDTAYFPFQSGPSERAGIYDVTVTLAGYQTWTRENVAVKEEGCHVKTRELLARLVPTPAEALR